MSSSDNQVALSRMTRGTLGALSKATRQAVPPFLQKLYEMVSDSATDSLIRWSDSGDSFFVLDHERVAHDVLPRWFKHNNFASFVRQLNMYGFHKIPHLQQGVLKSETETEIWNFEHQNFHRNQPDLLCLITRKKQAPERQVDEAQLGDKDGAHGCSTTGLSAGSLVDINSIVNGIGAIKRHQATISADLNDLKSSNQHLWQEALDARERHKKQQDTINRILKFLAGVFGNSATAHKGSPRNGSPHPGIPRKRQRLMIEAGQESLKQVPLEPLDGEEPTVETSGDEGMPTGRLVELSPSPAFSKTPTVIPSISEVQTPLARFPEQSSRPTTDALISGNFTSQSPFVPFSSPVSNSDSSMFTSPFMHSADSSSAHALTSASQNGTNHDVLQAIANSPGQLQRLLHLLNLQQQNVPMPPPLDLNASNSDFPNDFTGDFPDHQPSLHSQETPVPPLTVPDKLNLVEPDQQTLSLLQADDLSPLSFEPFLANEDQLQKSHRDAAAISEDIDAIQTSLDSLIHNLGFDPSEVTSMHEAEFSEQPDDNQAFEHPQADPVPAPSQPSSAHNLPNPTTIAPKSSTASDTDVNADMNGTQFHNTIPEFDFTAFINELTRQQNGDGGESGFNDFNTDGLDTYINDTPPSATTSPQPTAFVDEVTSQSDASSPSLTRATIIDDPVVVPTTADLSDPLKKGRKRKPDMDQIGSERERIQAKTKRKR